MSVLLPHYYTVLDAIKCHRGVASPKLSVHRIKVLIKIQEKCSEMNHRDDNKRLCSLG